MLFWIVALLVGLVGYFYLTSYSRRNYWKRKGVPGPTQGNLIGGQLKEIARLGQGHFDLKWTQKLGRIFGYFDGPVPIIVTSNTDMLRSIMVKDFSHFVNRRGVGLSGKVLDFGVNVLKDQRWKEVRSVLAPTFTSGKLRQNTSWRLGARSFDPVVPIPHNPNILNYAIDSESVETKTKKFGYRSTMGIRAMNNIINECVDQTVENMSQLSETGEEFEAKKLFATVTLDVIASTFFGTKIDSQNDPDNQFVKHAYNCFKFSFWNPAIVILLAFPQLIPLARKLGIQVMPKSSIDFFLRNTQEIIKLRIESNQIRRDFLQLMLTSLKEKDSTSYQTLKETRETRETKNEPDVLSDVLASGEVEENENLSGQADYKLTTKELVAQAIIFFLAGYETTATALSFITYLLTTHPEIQERLRTEIEDVMEGHEKPDYDLIAKMEYLDMCVNESLRLFPPVARTERACSKDWDYQGIRIEKGSVVGIPIFAIHRDPEFWPDPEVFNPERFSRENKQNIKPYTFQTFGQGPRNCIGMRFAYYEIKMVIVSLLRVFRFVSSPKTQVPLILKDAAFISARDGIWITVEKLSA